MKCFFPIAAHHEALLFVLMSVLLTGCAKHHASSKPANPPKPARIGSTEKGVASWYGEPYHGRRAADGEVFDMEKLTAAHRTLPFQTWVEVTNLKNGKHVDVRITDRGPFVDGRIIDLSRAAAREIDMLRAGIAPVKLRVIKPPRQTVSSIEPFADSLPVTEGTYAVQAGAFRDHDRAEAFAASLLLFPSVRLIPPEDPDRPLWKILVGKGLTQDAARTLAEELNPMSEKAFVVEDRVKD